MTQQTKIVWTDFTVNFWEGCQKVGPGCDNCYAEARDIRFTGGKHWGPSAPRRHVKGAPAKLTQIRRGSATFQAEQGRKPRVFFSSLSDVFDNAVPTDWPPKAFQQIEAATEIHAILLTKRIGNVESRAPSDWVLHGWPRHVGLMITVVNQTEANRDIPKLLDLKARLGIPWVGLSIEPMLGAVDLESDLGGTLWIGGQRGCGGMHYGDGSPGCPRNIRHHHHDNRCREGIDWVICGGESGPNARPMHPDWARSLRDQCTAAGTAFLFKQWGEWAPCDHLGDEVDGHKFGCFDDAGRWVYPVGQEFANAGRQIMFRVGKTRAGRLLDGREWNQFPEALNV